MKGRAITYIFAVCLVSSFVSSSALADNPTDAPLVTNYEIATVEQPGNQTAHKRREHKKKSEFQSAKAGCENTPRENDSTKQRDSESPATEHGYAGSN
jgi:hypothetical protein